MSAARTYVRRFSETSAKEVTRILQELTTEAASGLEKEGVPRSGMRTTCQVDVRYHGQGLRLTVDVAVQDLAKRGLAAISDQFDAEHKRLFTFALPLEHELVTLRAAVQGKGIAVKRPQVLKGSADPKAAIVGRQVAWMDGRKVQAVVYDRAGLRAGNRVKGPAIVVEMDSTTVILPRHSALVDKVGCLLVYPDGYKPPRSRPGR